MTFAEIEVFLKAHGVNTKKRTSGSNSKWVYVKDLLGDEPDAVVIRIADEIEVEHHHVVSSETIVRTPGYWTPLHFRLFLSHLSAFKRTTQQLQLALKQFGISGFVAHADIKPTKAWQDEIEAGLRTMDALAALLMPGFKESSWADQEVGCAVGRDVPVIPVIKGLDPYGFISKFQGIQANGKTVGQVAEAIFQAIVSGPRTRNKMLTCLVDLAVHSTKQQELEGYLEKLAALKAIPSVHLQKLQAAVGSTALLSKGPAKEAAISLLASHGLKPLVSTGPLEHVDDDIPF